MEIEFKSLESAIRELFHSRLVVTCVAAGTNARVYHILVFNLYVPIKLFHEMAHIKLWSDSKSTCNGKSHINSYLSCIPLRLRISTNNKEALVCKICHFICDVSELWKIHFA